ncbi:MAG TPA: MazG nucleotide pyrophosphohydrolase domain-containing protein [Acidimicrobiales bacterium]|nr:MazG nucleotide pyrophosphohydrolase domain-containing protein [Acidimicrobiales bacterium]
MSSQTVGPAVEALTDLIAQLRERCPWDREQTHASLVKYLVEESQEVVDALAALDTPGADRKVAYAELEEELGDLFLQVLLHAHLASEQGFFDLAGVAERLHAKLVRRHPHVFGDFVAETAEEVNANWERIKERERQDKGEP